MTMRVLGLVMVVWVMGCGETAPATRQGGGTTAAQQGGDSSDPAAHDPERHHATERVFARKAVELQECWVDEYNKTKNRKWETNMNIQVMVPPSGTGSSVKVLQSSNPNQAVETCVEKTIAGWSFPEGHSTMPYTRTVHLGAQF
jgi:hypothetical protein